MVPLLFYKVSIFDVLQRQEEMLRSEVSQLDATRLESVTEDMLIRDIAAKYKLETPVLEEDKAYISYREVNVDVSRDPMRAIWDRSRPFHIKGTEIRFTVPFKGDPNLFHVRPTTYTLNPPRGEVRGREIHLVQNRTDDNSAAARTEYERSLQTIKQYLGWLEVSISDFNAKIGGQVQGLLGKRKQLLASRAGMVAEIGLPIKQDFPVRVETPRNPVRTESLRKSLGSPKKWDVFISHATEDKNDFARPLAEALRDQGVSVWFDEFSLKMGDSLRASIDYGLANSRYGVVVLSKNFFAKHWAIKELNGLSTRESIGKNIILPIWLKIDHDEVKQHSPILADKLAVSADLGISVVVEKIIAALDQE